ncbi:MAG: HPF/RaiA family ribosome-associated protein [Myxococcota bacterium]
MRLFVRFRGLARPSTAAPEAVPDGLRAHAERRAGFSLSRFADALGSVVIRLEDQNGPKGGVDKRCRVEVRGPSIGTVVVEDVASRWTAAIDRALAAAGRATARAVARLRSDVRALPLGWVRRPLDT